LLLVIYLATLIDKLVPLKLWGGMTWYGVFKLVDRRD